MGETDGVEALVIIDPPVVPDRITLEDGEAVRQEMRALVKGDIASFWPKACVTYATDRRKDASGNFIDAEGTGPGMYLARWVAKLLDANEVTCFSGLCAGAGADWRIFHDKLGGPQSQCEYLFVVQTKAFFNSLPCLHELYTALCPAPRLGHERAKVHIIPLLFESDALSAPRWPRLKSRDMEAKEYIAVVNKEYFKLNSTPSPPLTVLEDQRGLHEKVLSAALDARTSDSLIMVPGEISAMMSASAGAAAGGASAGLKQLRDGMQLLQSALKSGEGAPDKTKRAIDLKHAVAKLRAAVASVDAGQVRNADNAERARRCLALSLFVSGCDALKQ